MEKSSCYQFHNIVNIRFTTDKPSFYNFVEETFAFFKSQKENLPIDLDVSVHFHGKVDYALKNRIAKNLFFEDKQALYYDKFGFSIYSRDDKPLVIRTVVGIALIREIYSFFRVGWRASREEKYLAIMRASFHLPLFYLLEREGYIILHGSAVTKDNKGYLFLGANYVGKTTLALNLVYRYGFKLLADDFLVIKDNKLYSFPDKIRVSPFTLNSIPLKVKGQLVYSKYHLTLAAKQIADFSYPRKIFFLKTGEKPILTVIGPANGLKWINAIHNYLHEFPEYSYLSFFSDFPKAGDIQQRYSEFLKNKEIFFFQASLDMDQNLKLLLGKLN